MVIRDVDELKQFEYRIKYTYDKIWFHELNGFKVDKTIAFWFGAPKGKACLIGGIKDNRLLFPYSSPFAMIEVFKGDKNEELEEYLNEIDSFCADNSIKEARLILPPMIYDETSITKWLAALSREGFLVDEVGLNFHIEIGSENDYLKKLQRNGKKNLKNALSRDYKMHLCLTEEEKKIAYDIIQKNRDSKGYYLSMSWDDVRKTISNVEHDFHILTIDDQDIAAAIVFKVTDDIWQVVYWGEIPGREFDRPMNYLPYALHEFYAGRGIRILDIGPSMWEGKPNYGLCNYKESIGCDVSSRFIMRKRYDYDRKD